MPEELRAGTASADTMLGWTEISTQLLVSGRACSLLEFTLSALLHVLVLLVALAVAGRVLRRLPDEERARLVRFAFAQSASRMVREVVEALLDVWAGQD